MRILSLLFVFVLLLTGSAVAQEAAVRPVLVLEQVPDQGLANQAGVTAQNMKAVVVEAVDVAKDVEAADKSAEQHVSVPMISPEDERFAEEDEAMAAAKAANEGKSEKDITLKDNLTDTIKENSTEEVNAPDGKTWIDKIKDVGKKAVGEKESSETLEGMVSKAKDDKPKGSNAAVFDVSGVMLRMNLPQVERTLENRGFKKVMASMEIPNFIKWRNEETCRNSGVVGYERLANCVIKLAQKDNHQYVETIKFTKFDTREDIEVKFTSNFTDNKAYRIMYKSMATNITGNSPQAVYTRNIKIYDFWKVISQKYGRPDNTQDVIWGLGDNKPYLRAATGQLLLEDPMLRELDYTRMSREDQRYMNTNLYSF